MKRSLASFVFVALVVGGLLSGCQESDSPVDVPSTSLQVSKDKIALSPAAMSDSSFVSLQCGCGFTLIVEDYSGDTSAIHYEQFDASANERRVALKFTGDPLVASRSYSAKYALLITGYKGTFRDTIEVEYTR